MPLLSKSSLYFVAILLMPAYCDFTPHSLPCLAPCHGRILWLSSLKSFLGLSYVCPWELGRDALVPPAFRVVKPLLVSNCPHCFLVKIFWLFWILLLRDFKTLHCFHFLFLTQMPKSHSLLLAIWKEDPKSMLSPLSSSL